MRSPVMRLAAVMLACITVLIAGCSQDDGTGRILKYDIAQGIENLDPQFAVEETARMIISNTFEGLFQQLPNGDVEPAAAKSYDVSPDGLTYTFHLRDDLLWSPDPDPKEAHDSPQPVTAPDFAFALQRLFNPEAPSPFAGQLLSIANAREVMNYIYPISSLGVRAIDNLTLEIQLEQKEALLPSLLASTFAMPCNRAFFQRTRGRYGLAADMLLYNGPFRVSNWNNQSSISLRQNHSYTGSVLPSGVELNIPSSIALTAESNYVSDPTERFLNGATDACKIAYERIPEALQAGASITEFEDKVWILVLNIQTRRFSNRDMRQAVAYAVDRGLFTSQLPDNMRATSTLIPPAISVNGRSFRDQVGNLSPMSYSPDLARRSFQKGLSDLGIDAASFAFGQILICDDDAQGFLTGFLQRTLQQELASPVGMVRLEEKELLRRVARGDFDAAIIPLSAQYSSPDAILSYFRGDSPTNFTGFQNDRLDAFLRTISTLAAEERVQAYSEVEQLLLTEAPVIPLYFEKSYYAAGAGVSGIGFSPFLSGMRFSNARKRNL